LWSSTDESRPDGGDPLDKNFTIYDFAPEAIDRAIEDCESFQDRFHEQYGFSVQAGHDFWLTRNGHGAGFWDGSYPEPEATILTDASKEYGEINVIVGNDNQLYFA
jgi:hypothetical protein